MQYFVAILAVVVISIAGYFFIGQTSLPGSGESVPAGSGAVSQERTRDLRGQGLTEVPSGLFEETDIEELDLSHNALDGALPAEIRNLQKLKVLDLSDNKFTGVPAEIGQLKELEILDLSNNELTGLPYELGNLSNLRLLNISGNAYSEADLSVIKGKLPSSAVVQTE